VEVTTMPEPVPSRDEVTGALRAVRDTPGRDTLMADVAPFVPDGRHAVDDVADDEWQAFLDALDG
jgi:hypothetical protein